MGLGLLASESGERHLMRVMRALPEEADREGHGSAVLTVPRSKNGETRHVPMTSMVRIKNNEDVRWAQRTVPAALRAAEIKNFDQRAWRVEELSMVQR